MVQMTVGLAELPTTPHFLYRLYDRTDTLLYLGITNDPKTRFKDHRKKKSWWPDVDHSKTIVKVYATRDEVFAAEESAIKAEHPLYNDQHNATVDTPMSLATQSAVREFADMLLHHATTGRNGRDVALREADEAIRKAAECPDEYGVYSQDRWQQAAMEVAIAGTNRAFSARRALELLFEFLPEEQVKRCREEAVEELEDFESQTSEDEILCWTATNIAYELAGDYLDTLPHIEAAGWRLAARGFLPEDDTEYSIEYHAARYAKAVKAKRDYPLADKLCSQHEWHKAKCHREARLLAHFADCDSCEAGKECRGHRLWCDKHLQEAKVGDRAWGGTNERIVVTRTSEPPEVEDPWKVPF